MSAIKARRLAAEPGAPVRFSALVAGPLQRYRGCNNGRKADGSHCGHAGQWVSVKDQSCFWIERRKIVTGRLAVGGAEYVVVTEPVRR